MKRIKVEVTGMTCQHCVSAVDRALAAVSGVGRVDVEIGQADVRFDESACSATDLVQAVEGAGFGVQGFRAESAD